MIYSALRNNTKIAETNKRELLYVNVNLTEVIFSAQKHDRLW
jgi:hypothetical protein